MRKNVWKVVLWIGVFALLDSFATGVGPERLPRPNCLTDRTLALGGGPAPLPGPELGTGMRVISCKSKDFRSGRFRQANLIGATSLLARAGRGV
jgi:hypothetical protein